MPGWCCCDAWQRWSKWTDAIAAVAYASLQSQLRRLRIHASALVFLYGSDELAPVAVERYFLLLF
jgi:exo-1,4-beta-D-glucosaminidase